MMYMFMAHGTTWLFSFIDTPAPKLEESDSFLQL